MNESNIYSLIDAFKIVCYELDKARNQFEDVKEQHEMLEKNISNLKVRRNDLLMQIDRLCRDKT